MTSKMETNVHETYEDTPPAYDHVENYTHDDIGSDSSYEGAFEQHTPPAGGISLPCVVPQTTKHFKGAFFSPFIRAYIPELAAHNISQSDFLAFVDGLNEAFVASPVFQGLGIVGRVMGMVYGVHAVQLAGLGVEFGAGAASTATSYIRTMMYVKAMNKDLFHPAGLHLNIMNTKKMMAKVEYPEDKLKLPPLDWSEDVDNESHLNAKEMLAERAGHGTQQDDPRMRRMKALEGYVMPIDMNVPEATAPDNLFKKMGATQAARMEKKQNNKLSKRRSKGERRYYKRTRKAERRQRKGESRVGNLETELEGNKAEKDERLAATEDPKQQRRIMKDFEKEEQKLQRKMEKRTSKTERRVGKSTNRADKSREKLDKKEHKTAHKIRWIVISQWKGDEESSDDDNGSLSASDSEVENAIADQTEKLNIAKN